MPELFELTELVSLMQIPEFDAFTAQLLRELTTIEIRNEVGAAVYDAFTDLSPFKGLALAVAKRAALNPTGVRSSSASVDDYTENITFAAETLYDVELTDADRDRIGRIVGRLLGRSSEAFTIRPAGRADTVLRSAWPRC